jgi:RHS repeat-associated protein
LWANSALAGVALQSFTIDPPQPEPEPAAPRTPFNVAADLPAHDATIGTLAGQAATEGGAATYTVPIVVPPGRAGMEPGLSLVYDSRNGDGVMGVGWSISGLSAVHRCPQTPEQDGATLGVSYTNSDRLCLDGQRLVKVTVGPYGQSGSEYRTEVDSYARITQTGGDLTGNGTCFRVERKDGRILHYGAVTIGSPLPTACAASLTSARVQPGGAAGTLSWQVERIEDRAGNFQTYAYANGGNGEVLPGTITYTGFGTTAGDRTVTFGYGARTAAAAGATDFASSYLAGGLTLQSRALTSITTQVGGATVRTVTPTHVAAAYSGRLLLKTLTECAYAGGESKCHPATRFAMNDSAYAPALSSLGDLGILNTGGANPTASVSAVRVIADLDGDGTRETAVSTVDANGVRKYYLVQTTADRVVHGAVEVPESQIAFGSSAYADFDNDGRAERFTTAAGGSNLQLVVCNLARGQVATGNPFRLVPTNIPIGVAGWGSGLGDFNGDGRVDIALAQETAACGSDSLGNKDGVFVYLNANPPGSFGASAAFTVPGGPLFCLARTGSGTTAQFEKLDRVADFNGDGLPDFFIQWGGVNVNRSGGVRLTQRSGGSIATTALSCSQMGLTDNPGGTDDDCSGTQGHVVHWMDVNGDGLDDFVIARPTQTWRLRLNKGGSLGPMIDTGSNAGLDVFNSTAAPFFKQFRYAGNLPPTDLDGDGKPELLVVSAAQGFALKMCTLAGVPPRAGSGECPPQRAADPADPADPESPTAVQCLAYACPEDPGTDTLSMPQDSEGNHSWNGKFVFGNYRGYRGISGLSDDSAYHLARLKFVQTAAAAFRLDLAETPLVSKLTGHGDDLYGDGLNDLISPIGGRTPQCPLNLNGGLAYFACNLTVGDGTWGPATLADGTSTNSLQSKTVVYANVNPGVTGPNQLLAEVPDQEPGFWTVQSPVPLKVLPELMWSVVDGVGDFASWAYSPLAFPLSQAGVPLYTVPSTNGYDDARHYYFQSTMPVVSGMLQGSGRGSEASATRSAVYGYDSAIYNNAGRGFQGFRKIVAENGQLLRTTTTYHQKFPLTGKVASIETAAAEDVSGTTLDRVQTETNTWRCTRTNRNAPCPGDSQTPLTVPTGTTVYQPFLDRQQVQTFDLATGGLSGHVDTINAASVTAATSGWDDPSCNLGTGTYGNLGKQVVVHSDKATGGIYVASHTRTTTNCYDLGGSGSWWVDKLKDSTVTSSVAYGSGHMLPSGATAPDQTRTTVYTWKTDRTPATKTTQSGVSNQQSTTTWSYPSPSYGLPTQVSVNAPDLAPALSPTRTTSYTYTKDGTTAAADGYFVLTATNGLLQTTTTTVRPGDGQILSATDPNGVQTVNTYDVFGQPTRTDYLGNTGQAYASAERRAWTSCRNASGEPGHCASSLAGEDTNETYAAYRVTSVREGHPTQVDWFDSLGRPIKHAERGFSGTFIASLTDYDAGGRVEQQSTPYFLNTTTPFFIGWTYDALDRPTQKIEPGDELDKTNGDVVTDYAYTGRSTTITVRAASIPLPGPDGCPTNTSLCMRQTHSTNVLGQLMRTSWQLDSKLQTTNYWTDPQGQLAAVQSPGGGLITARYNALGHRIASTDVDRGAWTFGVDAFGELLNQTDARGVVTTVTKRDALGRATERTAVPPASLPAGLMNETVVDRWSYDPANGLGRLGQQLRLRGTNRTTPGSNPEVWRESYGYEALTARPSTTNTTISEGTPVALASSQIYDTAGRLDTYTYPNPGGSALKVRYGYTNSGQLEQLSNAATSASYWTATAANQWGHVTQESWNSLSGSHRDYASTGRRYQLSWNGVGGSDQVIYGYDSFGNLTSQQRSLSGGGNPTERYRYDRLQRLIEAARPGSIVSYGYTPSGNLDFKSDFSVSTAGAYQYGAGNCGPHAVSSVALTTGAGTATYGCDANGNLISGSTISASYDAENRPRTMTKTLFLPGTPPCHRNDTVFCNGFERVPPSAQLGSTSWTYATDGSRSTETGSQGPRYFGPAGFEWHNGTAIHELGPVVVRRTGNSDAVAAILKDGLGSTLATVSSVATRRSYDAFGAARNADYSPRLNGTLNLGYTIHGFTGHTHADDVALIHMGGRVYDPNLGRFLSADPIVQDLANSQSINPYSYVLNNPFSGTDPSGYAVKCYDNKACGMSDAPTQDEQERKKGGPLSPLGNGADGLTPNGPQSAPLDGGAADIGTSGRTVKSIPILDKVVVRPEQNWVASRDVTWNIYGAEREDWAHRLAQRSGYDMIRGFYGFQWDLWSSQFTGDVPVVGVSGIASASLRGAGILEEGAAVAKEAGSIRGVNAVGGTMNCVNCAIATDATLAGRPASALNGGPFRIDVLETLFGGRFGAAGPIGSISESILAAGPGARGIVFGARSRGEVGHVFNVVNQNGTVRYLDGQTGQVASLEGYQSFQLLRTN